MKTVNNNNNNNICIVPYSSDESEVLSTTGYTINNYECIWINKNIFNLDLKTLRDSELRTVVGSALQTVGVTRIYLYEAKGEKELSTAISSDVPLLSPVSNHSQKCTFVQITIVLRVSFTCNMHAINPVCLRLRQCVFTCVGWQVKLYDPIWQVTLCSCEMEFH